MPVEVIVVLEEKKNKVHKKATDHLKVLKLAFRSKFVIDRKPILKLR